MPEYISIYTPDQQTKDEIKMEADKLGLSVSAFLFQCYESFKKEQTKKLNEKGQLENPI